MSTPTRTRSLRARLLNFITDATSRLTAAWSILTRAQDRLLAALSTIRPGRGATSRIRAATAAFQQGLATFDRAVTAFAERWASQDLPLVYREGAWQMLERADRSTSRWTWTTRHQQAITSLTAQYYVDILGRLREALRRARAFLRAAQDAARSGRFDVEQLRTDHPLGTVIYANDHRHPVHAWARAALSWQTVSTANAGGARTALDDMGCQFLEVNDSPDCGWTSHDDPDRANLTVRTIADALAHPLSHPNCVVAGTEVQAIGGIEFGYRFQKSGRFVEVRTATGRRVTVTPNHPILTCRGWIPACEIKKGDDVVVSAPEASAVPAALNLDQVPAPVEKVFAALGEACASTRAISSAEDFHGDGPVLDSQVDVVGADGQLWRVVNASFGQQAAQLDFEVADAIAPLLSSDGPPLQAFGGLDLAAPRSMGGFDVRRIVVPTPRLDVPFLESVSDGGITELEFPGEAKDRLSIDVATDDVVEVRYFDSAIRHVYDLSTSERAYFANGILVHNCVREFLPRLDLTGRTNIQSGAAL